MTTLEAIILGFIVGIFTGYFSVKILSNRKNKLDKNDN